MVLRIFMPIRDWKLEVTRVCQTAARLGPLRIGWFAVVSLLWLALASPSPAGDAPTATAAPEVDFEATPTLDAIGPDPKDQDSIFLVVTNKSGLTLKNVEIALQDKRFKLDGSLIYKAVEPYASVQTSGTIAASKPVDGAAYKLPLSVTYGWNSDGKDFVSSQSTTVSLRVKREFEDEASGLPGGTAALLYLLLPIIPAFFSYNFIDKLRTDHEAEIPTFSSEKVVFGFLLAVVVSCILQVTLKHSIQLAYWDPRILLRVTGVSVLAGAAVPLVRWMWTAWRNWDWGFKHEDTSCSYLRKALTRSKETPQFRWVHGKVGAVEWQGILLHQPDGTIALGGQLQASPKNNMTLAELQNQAGVDTYPKRKRLVELVEHDLVNVGFEAKIQRGNEALDAYVLVAEVQGFAETTSNTVPLVTFVG